MKPIIVTIGLTVILSGCAATGGGGTKSYVSQTNVQTLVEKKDVYIGQFAVTFVTKDSSSAKARSPMIRHSSASEYAQSTLSARLSGIPDATFQTIANEAYKDFVADLQAKGFTIKNLQDLEKIPQWQKLKPLELPYIPSGLKGLLNPSNQEYITYSAQPLDLFVVPDQPGQIKPVPYAFAEAAEAAGIPILAINYNVHFAYFDSETDYEVNYFKDVPASGGASRTLSASVSLGQGIQVTPGSAAQFIVDLGGTFSDNGSVSLKEPVVVGGAYGRNEDVTSTGQKAANAFSSAVGLFTGGSSKTTQIAVVATPEYYQFGALKALDEANNRIVNGLAPAP